MNIYPSFYELSGFSGLFLPWALPGATSWAPSGIVVLLAAVCGVLNMLSPDRWLPSSLLAWQKNWSVQKTALFSMGVLFGHVLAGWLLYRVFLLLLAGLMARLGDAQRLGLDFGSASFFLVVMVLVFSFGVARKFRFLRIQEVFRTGSRRVGAQGIWGSWMVLWLLGPCELVVPVFLKSKSMGVGCLTPFLAFLAGTWVAGIVLVAMSKPLWNYPLGLARILDWAYRSSFRLSMAVSMTTSLGFSLV
jgi:hypothetical protein